MRSTSWWGGDNHDVLNDTVLQRLRGDCAADKYGVGIVTPPCNTWTRLLHANNWGAKPVRDRHHPLGLPGLKPWDAKRLQAGNQFMKVSMELMELVHQHGAVILSEFPGDLGRTRNNAQPASPFPNG